MREIEEDSPRSAGTPRISRTGWLGAIIIASACAFAGYFSPPFTLVKPRDTKPPSDVLETAYVGNDVCARCHTEQATRYQQTGHAHTLHTRHICDHIAALKDHDIADPERKGRFRFECNNGELYVRYLSEDGDVALPIQFAVGSGKHAVTFLTLIAGVDGEPAAIEHRLSVFKQGTTTGLTPSHAGLPITTPMDCLGRTKHGRDVTTCISCHSTTGQIHGTRVDDLRAGVGCESCHGPGRRHVTAIEAGLKQTSIEFMARHRTADEELHLCGRCHRSTEALRVIPDPDDPKLARFQPVGLSQSACYQRSSGALRCSTCHDPHQSVEQAAGTFNAHCQNCHGASSSRTQISCTVQPGGDCTSCHMPAVEVHPGIRFHDHWIRRRKDRD